MHKADAEMKRAAKLAGYERRQFSYAANQSKYPYGLSSGTASDDPGRSAVIEVLLLHARVLRDFFTNRRPRPKRYETDILAEDFFDDPSQWRTVTLPFEYLTDTQTRGRLDQWLAHLTYGRWDGDRPGKGWDLPKVIEEIDGAWAAFLNALPEKRRAWFDYPYDDPKPDQPGSA
jgi:hypothetical protein